MTKKKILIIEDEGPMQKALLIEGKRQNFDIVSSSSGEDGLNLAKKIKPDLIALDMVLPIMDGFTVLTKLRQDESTKNIPVIILSNLGHEDDKIKALKNGAQDYIIKATTKLEEVFEVFKKYLN